MINWQVITKDRIYQDTTWYFPSFLIQEYLLPLINVGFNYIYDYEDTKFEIEDCQRMKGYISYLLDCQYYQRKINTSYDSFFDGIVNLDSKEIINCLNELDKALDFAIANNASLVFVGD